MSGAAARTGILRNKKNQERYKGSREQGVFKQTPKKVRKCEQQNYVWCGQQRIIRKEYCLLGIFMELSSVYKKVGVFVNVEMVVAVYIEGSIIRYI